MPFDLSWLDGHADKIAGAVGAAISSAIRPASTLTGAVLHLISGALCAHYLGSPLIAYFALPVPYQPATYFLVGVFGLTVLRGLMAAIEKYDFAKHFPKGDK